MKDWFALKSIVAMLGVAAVSLLLIACAFALGWDDWLVPPPEKAAEGLVVALGAHRYSGAREALSQDLNAQLSDDDLRTLMEAIKQSKNGIEEAHGEAAQEQGDQALATVKIKFGNRQEQTVQLPLKKENNEWLVSSLEPLNSLK